MKPYKKRAKGSWCSGKDHKDTSNSKERMYEKEEIRDEMEQFEQGDDYRHRRKGKKQFKTKYEAEKHKLEVRRGRCEKMVQIFEKWKDDAGWGRSVYYEYLNDIKKIDKQLEELEQDNEN